MFKKLFILCLLVTSLFGGIRELTDENFERATGRGLVVVEFWATWNEKNKVVLLDTWDTFDAKVYRVNIDLYPKIQANNDVVIPELATNADIIATVNQLLQKMGENPAETANKKEVKTLMIS